MSDQTLIEPGDAIQPGDPPTVHRYSPATRLNHWITAVTMILLILSGLGLYYPALFFLSALFGGGQLLRTLHPWLGVVLVLSFSLLFVRFWRGNLWRSEDADWVAHMGDLVAGREEKMPEIGKYNAGQKFVFWSLALLILGMFVTGVLFWQEYFAPGVPIPLQRVAIVVHSVFAVFVILVIILHVYSAIWVRGSFDAMIKGHVSAGWAFRHHRKWFRRLVEQSRGGSGRAT
jgi:formate dehydrogenase subunit gamma